jgi:hypothetical protein
VAAGLDDAVHVVWGGYDPIAERTDVYYRRYQPSSGWQEINALTAAPIPGGSLNPDIAVDGCGNLGVLYDDYGNPPVYLKRWDAAGASIPDEGRGIPVLVSARACPNPFHSSTELIYFVGGMTPRDTRVDVFDIRGRLVRKVFAGVQAAGAQSIRWDGCDGNGQVQSPGVYYVRVTAGARREVFSITLLR